MVSGQRLLDTFSLRMRRNGYLGASGQKSDPPFAPATLISYKTGKFPLSDDVHKPKNICWTCHLGLRPFWPWGV